MSALVEALRLVSALEAAYSLGYADACETLATRSHRGLYGMREGMESVIIPSRVKILTL